MKREERIEWLKGCTQKERREYYGEVANLRCIICGKLANTHHCYGHNFPAKREFRPCVPLCYDHHQGNGGIHSGKQTFEDTYGDQDYLLLLTEAHLEQSEQTKRESRGVGSKEPFA